MEEKEFNITDVVYLIYNNRPVKGVVTNKIKLNHKMLDISNRADLNTIKSFPSSILRLIQEKDEILYNVSIIPEDENDIEFTPIQGAFYGSSLYESKLDFMSAIDKMVS